MSLINEKIERAFSLTQDLAEHLEEDQLGLKLTRPAFQYNRRAAVVHDWCSGKLFECDQK